MSSEYEIFETDIAIVGMAARLPGARNIDEYWKNLEAGVESIRHYSHEELLQNGESPEALARPGYVPAAAPMPDMELFDGDFFGFSPKESAIMDPQHRQFLEVCWEALENAAHPPEKFDGRIGMFAGCGMGSYFYFNVCSHPELVRDVGMFLLRHTGNDKDFLATRASYLLDLRGPSIGVQTACSTSLVATHLAVQSLLNRESDMALAGGVTIELPHRRGYQYHEGEVLSPDGHCHAFDHRGQGTVFGSGAGVVVLRRLEDALDDGDLIHGVIRGSAINNDGSLKMNYLAPSVDGQASCMVEAYGVSNVDPRTIEFIECHGTGTALGDPIEVSALTQAFRVHTKDKGFCHLGSVKTNIGHLDTAAGVAGLIKATLALKHKTIPKTLGYEKPNPNIDFARSPFMVASEKIDWPAPANHPRRAAVNSLGVGGTNAHVVLQEPPDFGDAEPSNRAAQLLTLSAGSKSSLDAQAKRLAAFLRERSSSVSLADVAYTLHVGRRDFSFRRVVAAESPEEAAELLETSDTYRVFNHRTTPSKKAAEVAFLLPGGGAQYVGMGKDLYEGEPVFREVMDRGFELLKSKCDVDLKPVLYASPSSENERGALEKKLATMALQLPATFLTSVAMARLFESWGVTPSALLGHSLGENTAAHLAGVFNFEDALGLVLLRGQLLDKAPEGAMLSMGLPESRVREILAENTELALDLAVINGPEACVVSGAPAEIDKLEAVLETLAKADEAIEDADIRRLAIPAPAHSRLLDGVLGEFKAYLESITLSPPKIPVLSNYSGALLSNGQATDPDYWVRHLRGTVRYAENVETLMNQGTTVLLETGPGRTLSSLSRQAPHFQSSGCHAFSSMRHGEHEVDDNTFFTTALGRLWASGADFEWGALWPDELRTRLALPSYAWDHKPYFIERAEGVTSNSPAEFRRENDIESWGHVPRWTPSLPGAQSEDTHTWLVFLDAGGVGARLLEQLKSAGHTVITVRESDAFARVDDHEYLLSPERGREGYDSLLRDLVERGNTPARIAHLWLLDATEQFRPGSSLEHHQSERGFYSFLFLAQALQSEGVENVHLYAIMNGALSAGDPVAYPEKALSLGPLQVIPKELDSVTTSLIDVKLPKRSSRLFGGTLRGALLDPFRGKRHMEDALDALSQELLEELLAEPQAQSEVVALRDGKRLRREYTQVSLAETAPAKSGGTYLVTGGLGGIGMTLAMGLAERAGAEGKKAKIALISRSPLPVKSQWGDWMRQHGSGERTSQRLRRLLDIEAAGAEILTLSADVTNVLDMRRAVNEVQSAFGPIDGVVHAAGGIDDGLISTKTVAGVEAVLAAKVQGTRVLDEALDLSSLDFCVLCSSTSTATAPAGQLDYVAANAFLDAFAESRKDRGNITSLHWGIWNEVGMAAESMSQKNLSLAGESTGEKPTHPLLTRRVRDQHGDAVVEGTLRPNAHWILDGHRTKAGHAVLPGTGYLELARGALEAAGETGSFEIEDLLFLRPFAVEENSERTIRVKLSPTSRGYRMSVLGSVSESTSQGKTREGFVTLATAHLSLGHVPEPKAHDLKAIEKRCNQLRETAKPGKHLTTAQEAHLNFGPRWHTLRHYKLGQGEGIAELSLSPDFDAELSDFGLHPALLDIATGWAMALIEGYEAKALFVPVGYERMRVYAPLTSKVTSWVRLASEAKASDEFVFFHVTLFDPKGNTLVEVERLGLRRLSMGFELNQKVAPSEVEWQAEARDLSPAEQRLAAQMSQGIKPSEGRDAFFRVLAGPKRAQVFISSLPLSGLIERAAQPAEEQGSAIQLARPELDSDFVEPRDDVEKTLAGFWRELLGVDSVGVLDSFFDLGGHSLIAVRLFSKIKRAYAVDFPISILFEAPTIEACAELIKARGAGSSDSDAPQNPSNDASKARRFEHLVAMHDGDGGPKTPFFLVAGMFGNVLNLRHLAHLVGRDRRFYGLQARGLYGDQAPHETFEEMAQAYLAEMKQVQPVGPYLLGGFSGGGITAFEIAHQLRKAGEDVELLVMLDTPVPEPPADLSIRDRALIQAQQLRDKGPGYLAEWAQTRWAWEAQKLRARFDDAEREAPAASFHNEAIEAAFRRALGRYQMTKLEGAIELYRPKLPVAYDLGNGRLINAQRDYVYEDNGWTPFVETVNITEVPGDHDSMVLEPNVRVLATHLKGAIDDAEARIRQRSILDTAVHP